MSSYISRWCERHGEWEQDIDNPWQECPACVREGTAPSQIAAKEKAERRAEIVSLRAENERLRATSLTLEQLEEIEWTFTRVHEKDADVTQGLCPVCEHAKHTTDCWLAAKIRAARGGS